MTHSQYVSDDGVTYKVRIPGWVASLTGAAAATTQASLPKGYRARRRFYRITATNAERSFVVPAVTQAPWTAAFGAGLIVPTFEAALSTTNNATYSGRTGERDKNI
jgi:hypothetical protein